MCALGSADRLFAYAHRIGEIKLHLANLTDGDLYFDDILESRRTLVVALDGNHWRGDPLGLNFVKTIAQLVEKVDAGLLHETDIIRVMRHAHAIAFIIFHFVLVGRHNVEFLAGKGRHFVQFERVGTDFFGNLTERPYLCRYFKITPL